MTTPIWYGSYPTSPAPFTPWRGFRGPTVSGILRRLRLLLRAAFPGAPARAAVRWERSTAATMTEPLAAIRTIPPKGRVLQVIGPSYRLSREEHGSSVVWDTRALAGGAGAFGLLLRADAVAYAMRGAGAASAPESHDGARDGVARLVENGVDVRYVEEDARERGLERLHLIDGVRPLKESDVPRHLSGYELVWRSRVETGILVL